MWWPVYNPHTMLFKPQLCDRCYIDSSIILLEDITRFVNSNKTLFKNIDIGLGVKTFAGLFFYDKMLVQAEFLDTFEPCVYAVVLGVQVFNLGLQLSNLR